MKMRLTDTKIVKEEYTLEALHDAFKTQFHEYLSKVFVYEDPYYYIMDFRNKYIYTDINKLQNEFRTPKNYGIIYFRLVNSKKCCIFAV